MRDIEGNEKTIVRIRVIKYHSTNFDKEIRIVQLKLHNRVEHAHKTKIIFSALCRLL